MKHPIFGLTILLAAASVVVSQAPLRVMTYPIVPRKEVFDRLNLTQAWHARLPTERHKDGLASVQVIPHPGGPQLVVQTISGTVFLLDGETGDILWKAQPGPPFWSMQPAGYNAHSIFVTRRDQLYILNRVNGRHRLYTIDPTLRTPSFGMSLLTAPSAAPTADDDMLFLSLGNRVAAYDLPKYGLLDREQALAALGKKPDPKPVRPVDYDRKEVDFPELLWLYLLGDQVVSASPLFTGGQVAVVTGDGTFLSFNKFERLLRFDFKARGHVDAGLGQHGNVAYLASADFGLYALDIGNEKVYWRFLSGAPNLRTPDITDRDIFLVAERIGLFRLDRLSGQEIWLNKQADRYLASNHRFVYAIDRQGNLLIMDYARGSVLGQYEMRDWQVPISNEWSDRVYLANHDGQVLCLHYKDNRFPAPMKSVVEFKLPPPEGKKKPPDEPKDMPKDPEKKDPDKKDPDKQ